MKSIGWRRCPIYGATLTEYAITNDLVLWYPEHSALLRDGMLHGIEVVNGREYYPEAHRWAIEKKLAMISNSDIHNPLNLDYHVREGDHRPLTLVFAKERSPEALKQALFARQTAVNTGSRLIGDEKYLRPIFTVAVQIKNPKFNLKGKQRVLVQIHNYCDADFKPKRVAELPEVSIPKEFTLAAQKTVLLAVTGKTTTERGRKKLSLPFKVTNLLIGPDEPLPVTIDLNVAFSPLSAK